ncbi:VTT domain-containing protein [Legionella londiniensis]|uniref:Secretion system protein Y n=1 Tax=Legionella londiniensis TaxID=45068 RepID=A0A0W0VPR5_9GAMM|nr:VTT domain-containing protein [Legionella londiniensis]KTD21734.1 secretion system protein Y [Legionella londiniensis]STX93429.1 DedA/PAP2 domain protein [Legionella londiniensis]
MDFFTDYLQPLSIWLHDNPHWALLITFLISFSESLAIIGSIIPGSVTMTAIGILAGSGVMRIDLTLLAATLGAIVGDTASYALGYKFHHRLIYIWPFSRYPHWLKYGKEYFARHGGKSVLIGRFIGPLRSIIPVIAGMMHMNHWQFLLANVVSAIGWAILYVMPGILIGAVGNELSTERASRLFLFVILLLVAIWLISIGIKWMFKHLNFFFRTYLHRFWLWGLGQNAFSNWFKAITPAFEKQYYPTVALLILFLSSVLLTVFLSCLVIQNAWIESVNTPVHLFLQSIRTPTFDLFFIFISLVIHPLSLATLVFSIIIYFMYHRDWRTLYFWLSLTCSSALAIGILAWLIKVPAPSDNTTVPGTAYYPDLHLTLATTILGFLIFYISTRYRTTLTLAVRIFFFIALFLAGISILYLGDNWLTSVISAYFIGLSICLGHWIFFRRVGQQQTRSHIPIVFSCFMLLVGTAISCWIYFTHQVLIHQPILKQYVFTENAWWSQEKSILPLYPKSRTGQRRGLFNIQYAGSLDTLKESLVAAGWKIYDDSFLYSLLLRTGAKETGYEYPLTAQFYHHMKPKLVLTYTSSINQPRLILRLWRSNYHVRKYDQPIWLGSLQFAGKDIKDKQVTDKNLPFKLILNALKGYKIKQLDIKANHIRSLPPNAIPSILLIKDPEIETK